MYDERACGKGPSGMRFRNGTESRNLLPLWKRDGKLLLFLRIKHKKMMKRLLLLASALFAVIGCGQNQNGKGYTVVKEFPVEETIEPVRVIQYDPVESNILALFRARDAGSAMRTTTATTLPIPKEPSRPTSKAGVKASTKLLKPRSPISPRSSQARQSPPTAPTCWSTASHGRSSTCTPSTPESVWLKCT